MRRRLAGLTINSRWAYLLFLLPVFLAGCGGAAQLTHIPSGTKFYEAPNPINVGVLNLDNNTDRVYKQGDQTIFWLQSGFSFSEEPPQALNRVVFDEVRSAGLFKSVERVDLSSSSLMGNLEVLRKERRLDAVLAGEVYDFKSGWRPHGIIWILPTSLLSVVGVPTIITKYKGHATYDLRLVDLHSRKILWSSGKKTSNFESGWFLNAWSTDAKNWNENNRNLVNKFIEDISHDLAEASNSGSIMAQYKSTGVAAAPSPPVKAPPPPSKPVVVEKVIEKPVVVEKIIERPAPKMAAPTVEILYPQDQSKTKLSEIEIKIHISSEGQIKKISILVNGQATELTSEELQKLPRESGEPKSRGLRTLSRKIPLVEGRNFVQIQALDEANSLGLASVMVQKEGKDEAARPLKTANKVWLLSVGISKYKQSEFNLSFADRDAQALYDLLTDPQKGVVNKAQNSRLLLNEEATRENILEALNNIFKQAFDEDFIILYMAMHGMVDPDGSELYFIAHDTRPGSLVATGVPQGEVEKAISKSRAGKVLMVVDTCHSGSAGLSGVFAQRAISTAAVSNRLLNKIAVVKRGISIFTASSSTEFSQENITWGGGHGVFTHYLVEGLKGKADENKDGFITLRELYDYTYRRVKEETQSNQHPEIKGTLDTNIPLAEVR